MEPATPTVDPVDAARDAFAAAVDEAGRLVDLADRLAGAVHALNAFPADRYDTLRPVGPTHEATLTDLTRIAETATVMLAKAVDLRTTARSNYAKAKGDQ